MRIFDWLRPKKPKTNTKTPVSDPAIAFLDGLAKGTVKIPERAKPKLPTTTSAPTAAPPPAPPAPQLQESKRDVMLAALGLVDDIVDGGALYRAVALTGYSEEDVQEGCWQVLAGVMRDAGRNPSDWSELRRMVRTHGDGYWVGWLDLVLAQIEARSKRGSLPDLSRFS